MQSLEFFNFSGINPGGQRPRWVKQLVKGTLLEGLMLLSGKHPGSTTSLDQRSHMQWGRDFTDPHRGSSQRTVIVMSQTGLAPQSSP